MKSNLFQQWTQKDITFLRKNYQRMTYNELAKKLGRTEGSVKTHVTVSLGLRKTRKWTRHDDLQIKQFTKQGLTYVEIGEKFGVSSDVVRLRARNGMNIRRHSEAINALTANKILRECRKLSNEQLSIRHGVPLHVVKYLLHSNGITRTDADLVRIRESKQQSVAA